MNDFWNIPGLIGGGRTLDMDDLGTCQGCYLGGKTPGMHMDDLGDMPGLLVRRR